jgi:uncharacterized protein YjbI with pentapeptide repeats
MAESIADALDGDIADTNYVDGPGWSGVATRMPVGSHCNIAHYQLLKDCSARGDIEPWNTYRSEHPEETIMLQGASLNGVQLDEAFLWGAHLEHAMLMNASLNRANLGNAHLHHADLWRTHLCDAKLWSAHLRGANLMDTHLDETDLGYADLHGAVLRNASLCRAILTHATLDEATLDEANLSHAHLASASLVGTSFQYAILQNATFWGNAINTDTDFSGATISDARMCPELEMQLEYNLRRKYWCESMRWKPAPKTASKATLAWLGLTQFPRWLMIRLFVGIFWKASDYGTSSTRLLRVFLLLSLGFAAIYRLYPSWILGLLPTDAAGEMIPISDGVLLLRSLYFSIVTMTTLGFGDIYAAPASWQGHIVLIVQVLLGYVLLGALITRFGIMFTSKTPCPKVPRAKKKK